MGPVGYETKFEINFGTSNIFYEYEFSYKNSIKILI